MIAWHSLYLTPFSRIHPVVWLTTMQSLFSSTVSLYLTFLFLCFLGIQTLARFVCIHDLIATVCHRQQEGSIEFHANTYGFLTQRSGQVTERLWRKLGWTACLASRAGRVCQKIRSALGRSHRKAAGVLRRIKLNGVDWREGDLSESGFDH